MQYGGWLLRVCVQERRCDRKHNLQLFERHRRAPHCLREGLESEKGVGGQRLVLRPTGLPHGVLTFLLRTPGAWHTSHKPTFPLILPAFPIVALDSAVVPSAFGSFFKSCDSCSLL